MRVFTLAFLVTETFEPFVFVSTVDERSLMIFDEKSVLISFSSDLLIPGLGKVILNAHELL